MTADLEAARALDPEAFRIGDRNPSRVARPRSQDELAETVRAAAKDGLALVPWGGGVALARERPPSRYDLALDLTGLDRVIEYEPEDQTLTAECGVTIQSLRALLAARGQELPLEASHSDRATLGGVLAANASGPRRLRFGAPRDRILGARFVLADGTAARSGGKVVKNVAGYGIHRLLCGSRGGLAIFVEASLKLMPAPARRVALVYRATPARLGDASRWSSFPRLEPALLSVVGPAAAASLSPPIDISGAEAAVVVGLEDDDAWVERQLARIVHALGEPVARSEAEEARALWQGLADLEELDGPRLSFATASNTPAALAPLVADGIPERLVFHAPAGRLHLFPEPGEARSLIDRLAEHGFTWIGGRGMQSRSPALPPTAATLRLRSRIREALDPARSMALGEAWEQGATG
jgi:glycolate oxidase FAD binding subunit